MTEKEKFLAWYERAKAKGLVDFNFTPAWSPGPAPAGVTEEDIYRELNAMNDAFERGEARPLTGI